MPLTEERTDPGSSLCAMWQGGGRRKCMDKAHLPVKVSEWGHGPHAPNSYPPACASGNACSPPPLVGQNHWPHQARPGWGLSRTEVQGPEGPLRSLPLFQSPGQARGLAWSSGWAAVSFGAGIDSVKMVPKMTFPKSFWQHEGWKKNIFKHTNMHGETKTYLCLKLAITSKHFNQLCLRNWWMILGQTGSWLLSSTWAYLGFFALESASWQSAAGRFSVFTATTEAIQLLKHDWTHVPTIDHFS